MTDAMTKAFSHLGMSADVFLGMFDDSKYVESLKKEFAQKIPKTNGKRILSWICSSIWIK